MYDAYYEHEKVRNILLKLTFMWLLAFSSTVEKHKKKKCPYECTWLSNSKDWRNHVMPNQVVKCIFFKKLMYSLLVNN